MELIGGEIVEDAGIYVCDIDEGLFLIAEELLLLDIEAYQSEKKAAGKPAYIVVLPLELREGAKAVAEAAGETISDFVLRCVAAGLAAARKPSPSI